MAIISTVVYNRLNSQASWSPNPGITRITYKSRLLAAQQLIIYAYHFVGVWAVVWGIPLPARMNSSHQPACYFFLEIHPHTEDGLW